MATPKKKTGADKVADTFGGGLGAAVAAKRKRLAALQKMEKQLGIGSGSKK